MDNPSYIGAVVTLLADCFLIIVMVSQSLHTAQVYLHSAKLDIHPHECFSTQGFVAVISLSENHKTTDNDSRLSHKLERPTQQLTFYFESHFTAHHDPIGWIVVMWSD